MVKGAKFDHERAKAYGNRVALAEYYENSGTKKARQGWIAWWVACAGLVTELRRQHRAR